MKLILASLAFAGLAAAAVAGTPRAAADAAVTASANESLPSEACIRPGEIVNHTLSADRHSLYVLVSGKGTYRLDVNGACLQGATRGDGVAFSAVGGASRACKPHELAVDVSKGGARPCTVQSITRLTTAQAKALSKDERP